MYINFFHKIVLLFIGGDLDEDKIVWTDDGCCIVLTFTNPDGINDGVSVFMF